MKFLFRLVCCLLVALSTGCVTERATGLHAPQRATSAPTPLLLISIDAYRADYIQRGLSPTLQRLADQGVRAQSMQPSFPSLTFPNHYTIVTGLRPDHHGIVNNRMYDPTLGKFALGHSTAIDDGRWWAAGTPIWETADAHGIRTATMFWPGSSADIHGHHPDYWIPYNGKLTAMQRVDQVLAWLDLPAAERPGFLTLYFDRVDHAGHDFGPDSPQLDAALRNTDAALSHLIRGLRQRGLFGRINILVISDHGMASVPRDHNIWIDKLIPADRVQTVSLGVLAGFNPKPGHDFAKIEAAMEKPHRHMRCWDKSRVPTRFGYGKNPRVPQLLCLADVGWRITSQARLAVHRKVSLGDHGYDNADPRMQALFIAHGPAFRRGIVVKPFPNVDVYPLMAHLLGVSPMPNDGSDEAVENMLEPASH